MRGNIFVQQFIIVIRHVPRYIYSIFDIINRRFITLIKKFQTYRSDAQRAKLSATKLR